jgi:hypothetical protein
MTLSSFFVTRYGAQENLISTHGMQSVIEALRGLSPGAVRSVMPLVEQFLPLYLDMAQVRDVLGHD